MAKRVAQGTGTIRKKTVTRSGKEYTYWEARVTVGRDTGTGKQVQRSISGQTQREVREKLQGLTVAINDGTYQEPSKMTLGEWLDIWTTDYLGAAKPHTKKSYTGVIKNHIRPALGAVKLSALSPVHVQKFINGIKSKKATTLGNTVNPKTVKNVHGILHSALSQAIHCGYLRSNPADRTILPKRSKADFHILEAKQLPAFFEAIEGHRFQYLYLIDLFTGLRQSELLGLQWKDIDFERGTVNVRRQLQYLGSAHGGYQFQTPKSGKSRMVTVPQKALDAFKRQRSLQGCMRLAAGQLWDNPNDLVFTDEAGTHIKHDVIYRHLKRIFEGMGIPGLRFHDLRHSYAVLSLQSGSDIKTVQENLGHYAAAFTLDTYAHATDQMKRDGASKMDRFLDEIAAG